jgi:hypothetical protein
MASGCTRCRVMALLPPEPASKSTGHRAPPKGYYNKHRWEEGSAVVAAGTRLKVLALIPNRLMPALRRLLRFGLAP